MQSKRTTPLAREQMTPDDLRLSERVKQAYDVSTTRLLPILAEKMRPWRIYALRKPDNTSRPLFQCANDILALANAGATESECRMHAILLDEVIDDLYCGNAVRTIDVLDEEEFRLGQAGDRLTSLRWRSEAVTPEQLRREAMKDRKEAAVACERARVLEREARRVERSQFAAEPRRAHA